jgi:hypothetical protein
MATLTIEAGMKKPERTATRRKVRCAYDLGLAEGRRRTELRVKRSIDCLTKTNTTLLTLVRMFDTDFPLQAVTLPLPLAERILTLLCELRPKSKEIADLEHAVEVCRQELAPPADELEELVG